MSDPEEGGIEVTCECTFRFMAASSLKGGLTNCPDCGKAVSVPGGPEALFWILLAGGVLLTLSVAAAFWFTVGPVGGVIVLGLGGVAITVAVLAS